jgi:hypothetical protein
MHRQSSPAEEIPKSLRLHIPRADQWQYPPPVLREEIFPRRFFPKYPRRPSRPGNGVAYIPPSFTHSGMGLTQLKTAWNHTVFVSPSNPGLRNAVTDTLFFHHTTGYLALHREHGTAVNNCWRKPRSLRVRHSNPLTRGAQIASAAKLLRIILARAA